MGAAPLDDRIMLHTRCALDPEKRETTYVVGGWPERSLFSSDLVRQADPAFLSLAYPFLTVRVANGHAVYRVDTCERGVWLGALVESSFLGDLPEAIERSPHAA